MTLAGGKRDLQPTRPRQMQHTLEYIEAVAEDNGIGQTGLVVSQRIRAGWEWLGRSTEPSRTGTAQARLRRGCSSPPSPSSASSLFPVASGLAGTYPRSASPPSKAQAPHERENVAGLRQKLPPRRTPPTALRKAVPRGKETPLGDNSICLPGGSHPTALLRAFARTAAQEGADWANLRSAADGHSHRCGFTSGVIRTDATLDPTTSEAAGSSQQRTAS